MVLSVAPPPDLPIRFDPSKSKTAKRQLRAFLFALICQRGAGLAAEPSGKEDVPSTVGAGHGVCQIASGCSGPLRPHEQSLERQLATATGFVPRRRRAGENEKQTLPTKTKNAREDAKKGHTKIQIGSGGRFGRKTSPFVGRPSATLSLASPTLLRRERCGPDGYSTSWYGKRSKNFRVLSFS